MQRPPPNRRLIQAGTASGLISTSDGSIAWPPPPAGTILDLLARYGLTCRNYFTDLPTTAIIDSNVKKHPLDYATIEQFHIDAALGTLPAVSFVDSEMGLFDDVLGPLQSYLRDVPDLPPVINDALNRLQTYSGDEENPADVALGEDFVSRVVHSVMSGPAWSRTLLVWSYDEHGGYYDHVAPPTAPKPDGIAPYLSPGNARGDYSRYGIRVPAVIVSPYSRPHAVTDVVHDHTSVLATIERRWNLPALTYRDANAATLVDFLDLDRAPAFLKPPTLAAPGEPTFGGNSCDVTVPPVVVTKT